MFEQEAAIRLHVRRAEREQQKRACNAMIRTRKEYFWDKMSKNDALKSIQKDTEAFYRPDGPFYIFVNLCSLIDGDNPRFQDSTAVCVAMAKLGVILIPGTLFDENPDEAKGMNKIGVRVSFAAFEEAQWKAQIDGVVDAFGKISN